MHPPLAAAGDDYDFFVALVADDFATTHDVAEEEDVADAFVSGSAQEVFRFR